MDYGETSPSAFVNGSSAPSDGLERKRGGSGNPTSSPSDDPRIKRKRTQWNLEMTTTQIRIPVLPPLPTLIPRAVELGDIVFHLVHILAQAPVNRQLTIADVSMLLAESTA